jgi:hypothetical protein
MASTETRLEFRKEKCWLPEKTVFQLPLHLQAIEKTGLPTEIGLPLAAYSGAVTVVYMPRGVVHHNIE